jgi:O-methyltransferase involved in polyketide biosynthesis
MADSQLQLDLTGVEETALLTLYARAIESQSEDPILKDEKLEAMLKHLDPLLENPCWISTGWIQSQLSTDPPWSLLKGYLCIYQGKK